MYLVYHNLKTMKTEAVTVIIDEVIRLPLLFSDGVGFGLFFGGAKVGLFSGGAEVGLFSIKRK